MIFFLVMCHINPATYVPQQLIPSDKLEKRRNENQVKKQDSRDYPITYREPPYTPTTCDVDAN